MFWTTLDRLLKDLESDRPGARERAVKGLGSKKDPRAVAALRAELAASYGQDWRFEEACNSLSKIGTADALEALRSTLDLKPNGYPLSDNYQKRIVQALEKGGYRPKFSQEQIRFAMLKGNYEEAVRVGDVAIEPLIEELRKFKNVRRFDEQTGTRFRGLLEAFSKQPAPRIAEAIRIAFRDSLKIEYQYYGSEYKSFVDVLRRIDAAGLVAELLAPLQAGERPWLVETLEQTLPPVLPLLSVEVLTLAANVADIKKTRLVESDFGHLVDADAGSESLEKIRQLATEALRSRTTGGKGDRG